MNGARAERPRRLERSDRVRQEGARFSIYLTAILLSERAERKRRAKRSPGDSNGVRVWRQP